MPGDRPRKRNRQQQRQTAEAARRRRLSARWALILRRFRDHVHDNLSEQLGDEPDGTH